MKIRGGYLPRLQGRPSSDVEECAPTKRLALPLLVRGIRYQPAVTEGQRVRFGDVLATARWCRQASCEGGTVALPAPAAGRVSVETDEKGCPVRLSLEVEDDVVEPVAGLLADGGRGVGASELRCRLARGGVWALLYESSPRSVPLLDGPPPKAIIVTAVKAEPFRARGNVILARHQELFHAGLGFLERLLEGYGAIHLVLTAEQSPLARETKSAVAGRAWVQATFVPLTYPVENQRVLTKALHELEPGLDPEDPIWVLDVQAVVAMARCLVEGVPLAQRMVVVGGPACPQPRHLSVRIGTPVAALLGGSLSEGVRVLRGGLFTGTVIEPGGEWVEPTDDAFFLLPEQQERPLLGFLRPGLDRDSYAPAFLSTFFPRRPRPAHAGLGGERRPCISCGFCEEVCPAGIMPHLIHRLLALEEPASTTGETQPSEAGLEEAQLLGAELCVNCGLCSYVCPSKLELAHEIEEGQQRIAAELAEEVSA